MCICLPFLPRSYWNVNKDIKNKSSRMLKTNRMPSAEISMTWINFWESESRWDHIDVQKQSNAQVETCECGVFRQDPHPERLWAWSPSVERKNKRLGQWSGELTTEQTKPWNSWATQACPPHSPYREALYPQVGHQRLHSEESTIFPKGLGAGMEAERSIV